MKTKPLTDAEVRWAIATSTNGTFDHQAFTDLLRCRRALRRILRVVNDPANIPSKCGPRVRFIAAEAVGKGGRG